MVDALTATAGLPKEAWKRTSGWHPILPDQKICSFADDNLGKILEMIFRSTGEAN